MSSVTFPTAIGGDGSTVTDDDNATTGLRNGGWRTRFIPCFTNLVNIADYVVTYTASTTAFATPPPIGSTTPNTGAFTRVTVTGSTVPANGMYLPGTNSLGFATNSSERVRINSSGNVGIGTSSPTARLSLSGSAGANIATFTDGTVNGSLFFGSSGNRSFQVGTVNAYPLILYTNSANTLTLDSSGNLGLGVTPSAWRTDVSFKAIQMPGGTFAAYVAGGLDPTPNIAANGYVDSGGTWRYINSRAASWYIQNGGMHAWYNAPSGTAGNAISFTQAMTLDASGNLLVGTTSAVGSARFSVAADTTTQNPMALSNTRSTAATDYSLLFYRAGNIVGSIQTSLTATTYVTSSDQRLKTNVAPAGSAIQSILNFPVDQFDWISTGEHQDFGAVAQKAINFIPEMVSVPADEDEMWGIDWSKAVPRLIKTIQELSAELNELKKRIN